MREHAEVCEITGLLDPDGWPEGTRPGCHPARAGPVTAVAGPHDSGEVPAKGQSSSDAASLVLPGSMHPVWACLAFSGQATEPWWSAHNGTAGSRSSLALSTCSRTGAGRSTPPPAATTAGTASCTMTPSPTAAGPVLPPRPIQSREQREFRCKCPPCGIYPPAGCRPVPLWMRPCAVVPPPNLVEGPQLDALGVQGDAGEDIQGGVRPQRRQNRPSCRPNDYPPTHKRWATVPAADLGLQTASGERDGVCRDRSGMTLDGRAGRRVDAEPLA